MLSSTLVAAVKIFIGAYPRWIGSQPSSNQRIYFANHSSHLDTVTLWAALPPALRDHTRPVAARDYWSHGIRKVIADQGFNAVLIERDRGKCEGDPLQPLFDALEAGDSLILFPEGTRNPEQQLLPFKSGLFHLAQRYPQVELIPVHLDNARRALPKGSMVPVPLVCTARFGAPLERIADEDKAHFLGRARQSVVDLA
ncbi:MAG: 1-acyl-sn-glycerol-3-phosphate acyltransferase [Proteobacteria bacterium]|nr:1-acyl-sn-glycerol-3-phosphate acyltransferase [Pseudomonadota bacterium]